MVKKIKELMGNLPEGRVSRLVLGALTIMALLIFCLFLFVGFATPSMLVPGFYEPQFTDTLLIYMYVIVTVAVVTMIISIGHSAWRRGMTMKKACGVPVTAIVVGVLALLVITMLTTFMLADTNAMTIGGKPYEDTLWLRLSDMFINTMLVLLVVAVLLMVVRRKGNNV